MSIRIQRLIDNDPKVMKWHLIPDNLNIHHSELLARRVTEHEGIAAEMLSAKGKSDILQ